MFTDYIIITAGVLEYPYIGSLYGVLSTNSTQVVSNLYCPQFIYSNIDGCNFTVSDGNGCDMYGGPLVLSCFNRKPFCDIVTISRSVSVIASST